MNIKLLEPSYLFMRNLFLLSLLLTFSCSDVNNFSDGPFIYIEEEKLIEKNVHKGRLKTKMLDKNAFQITYSQENAYYDNVDKIVALSDIHGQYDLFVSLLKQNSIIDNDLNWNFDNGHLVIVGDVFDRGDKVNDVLWTIYRLEKQAKIKGGRLHYLLGNHEYMVLQKDFRYLNDHHKKLSSFFNVEYDELYNNETVIGRWLRSKPTIIKINDIVFTHGGISEEFLNKYGSDFNLINSIMKNNIDTPREDLRSMEDYELFYGDNSLVWHREFFSNYGRQLDNDDIDNILSLLDSNHIVVGHTSQDNVVDLYDKRIFGVDSSMKLGEYGEFLLFENNKFYRVKLDGEKVEL